MSDRTTGTLLIYGTEAIDNYVSGAVIDLADVARTGKVSLGLVSLDHIDAFIEGVIEVAHLTDTDVLIVSDNYGQIRAREQTRGLTALPEREEATT
jgi:hypothetical protein